MPRDYLWMHPAILTAVGAAALILCLWRATAGRRAGWGSVAAVMAITAASVLTVDYGIQLAAVQPSLAAGRTEGLETGMSPGWKGAPSDEDDRIRATQRRTGDPTA